MNRFNGWPPIFPRGNPPAPEHGEACNGCWATRRKYLKWAARKRPAIVAPNAALYDLAKWIHTLIAWFGGALVGGHILIALKHHFLDKDDILAGMLPTRHR